MVKAAKGAATVCERVSHRENGIHMRESPFVPWGLGHGGDGRGGLCLPVGTWCVHWVTGGWSGSWVEAL
jgi:hypothetical protein